MEFIMSPAATAAAQMALKYAEAFFTRSGTRATIFTIAPEIDIMRVHARGADARTVSGRLRTLYCIVIITSILFTLFAKIDVIMMTTIYIL
jgi:hypothetical protein